MDWSEAMISAARGQIVGKRMNRWIVGDGAGCLPFRSGAFDIVVSCLAAMDTIELAQSLADSFRVTRAEGSGYWIIPDPDGIDGSTSEYFVVEAYESCPIPEAEWAAWVRIAPSQPRPTLYIHRGRATYEMLLRRAGWVIRGSETLGGAGTARAVMFAATKPGTDAKNRDSLIRARRARD
jgi:hypothetical protein